MGVRITLLLLVAVLLFPREAQTEVRNVLGGVRVVMLPLSTHIKWSEVRKRHEAQEHGATWQNIRAQVRALPAAEHLAAVNRIVNEVRYVTDGVDRWLTPNEFFAKGGDCEDYVIAKLFLLKELGIPASSMEMLALKPGPGERVPHMILVVERGGKQMVLDNQHSDIYFLNNNVRSRVLYVVNDHFWGSIVRQ